MKFGCCTNIQNLEILEKLEYDYIELAGNSVAAMSEAEFARVRDRLEKSSVNCCGFNAALPSNVAIIGDSFNEKVAQEYAFRLCLRGALLGISAIGIGSPKSRILPKAFDVLEQWKVAYKFLTIFAQEAAKFEINVLYEALNKTETDFGISLVEGLDVVENVGMDNVKLVLDIYHMYMQNESIEDVCRVMPYVTHVHIAERIGDLRAYPTYDKYEYYKDVFRNIMASGYDKIVSTEAFDGDVEEGLVVTKKLVSEIISEIRREK